MDANRITIGQKTYDMNLLTRKRKTDLRRKLIIEFIESKPAGHVIPLVQFMEVARFNTLANTHSFINRMIRDGLISQYRGDRLRTYYYAVIGSIRVRKIIPDVFYDIKQVSNIVTPLQAPLVAPTPPVVSLATPELNGFIADMNRLGVKFTITLSNIKEV